MSTIATPPTESVRDAFMIRLFSDLQVARYNELYYSIRAKQERTWATRIHIVAALASCGAFLGILRAIPPIWGPGTGSGFAGALTVTAGVCAAIAPILGFEAKASQFEKAAFGHGVVRERIKRLLSELKLCEIDDSHHALDAEISSFREALSGFDEPGRKSVKDLAWADTLKEYPSECAWNGL